MLMGMLTDADADDEAGDADYDGRNARTDDGGDDVDDDNHPVGYNDRGKHGTVARFSLLFSLFLIQRSSV